MDLETILLKAIEKNPAERYATAGELAEDLKRFDDDRPIQARRPTLVKKSTKWCVRHRSLVATIAIAMVLLLGFLAAGSTVLTVRLIGINKQEVAVAKKERKIRQELERSNRRISELLASSYVDQSQSLCEKGEIGIGLHWLIEALQVAPEDSIDLRRVTRLNLAVWSRRLHRLESVLLNEFPATSMVFCGEAAKVLAIYSDGTAKLWDLTSNDPVGKPIDHADRILQAAYDANQQLIALGTNSGTIQLLDAVSGMPKNGGPELQVSGAVNTLAFNQAGTEMLVGTKAGLAVVLDCTTGKPIAEPIKGHSAMYAATFSSDGVPFVVESAKPDNDARYPWFHQLWNVRQRATVGQVVRDPLTTGIRILPNGKQFATGTGNNRLGIWEAATGERIAKMEHEGDILGVAMSSDGGEFATGGRDRKILVWDGNTFESIGRPLRHRALIRALEFDSSGEKLITGSDDGVCKTWTIASSHDALATIQQAWSGVLGPFGQRVVVVDMEGATQTWDATTGSSVGRPFPALSVNSAEVKVFDITSDGSRIFVGSRAGDGQVWNVLTSKPIGSSISHSDWIRDADFSSDGSRIVVGSHDGVAQIWNTETGRQVGPRLEHQKPVYAVAISPDSSRIATGSWDIVQLWNIDGTKDGEPIQHEDPVESVDFSPDGKLIATAAGRNGHIWDMETRQPVGKTLQHQMSLRAIVFNPDPKRNQVLTGSLDKTAKFWDVSTGKQIGPALEHTGGVWQVSFSSDGSTVLLAGNYGDVRVFKCPPASVAATSLKRLQRWVEVITGSELDSDAGGRIKVLDTKTWQSRRRQLDELGGPPIFY